MVIEKKRTVRTTRMTHSDGAVLIRTHVDSETGQRLAKIKKHLHLGTMGEAISFIVRQYGEDVLSLDVGRGEVATGPENAQKMPGTEHTEDVMTEEDIRALCGFDDGT